MHSLDKMRMLEEYRKKKSDVSKEEESDEEESKVHAELLYKKEPKDYRSPEFEKKWKPDLWESLSSSMALAATVAQGEKVSKEIHRPV